MCGWEAFNYIEKSNSILKKNSISNTIVTTEIKKIEILRHVIDKTFSHVKEAI